MLKEFEENNLLFNNFIQGWYIDKNLTDYFLEKFKLLHNDKKTTKNTPPRNYYYVNVNNENFSNQQFANLINAYREVINNYQKKYIFSSFEHEGPYGIFKNDFMIKVFESNEYYDIFHHEKTNETCYRTLATLLYLNDIDDGGETEFFYQGIKIKPKKGLMLVWPAQWTHTHKGTPTGVKKYIISAYMEYFNLNKHLIDFTKFNSEQKIYF